MAPSSVYSTNMYDKHVCAHKHTFTHITSQRALERYFIIRNMKPWIAFNEWMNELQVKMPFIISISPKLVIHLFPVCKQQAEMQMNKQTIFVCNMGEILYYLLFKFLSGCVAIAIWEDNNEVKYACCVHMRRMKTTNTNNSILTWYYRRRGGGGGGRYNSNRQTAKPTHYDKWMKL